ncbi:MAG: hypothetical protein KJ732_05505 [Candidatus Margulisbacteria bacterium]|nr:hypothetical protein [Candidatus Margulisiibacteriota bacterium]
MKKGNLLIVFILIIGLAAIVGSIAFLTSTSIKSAGYLIKNDKAFYIAEAGLEKAIWNFNTGIGSSWRTSGSTESFGGGSYTMRVADAPNGDVIITAEGSYQGRTRSLQIRYQQYSDAFDYAVYSIQDLSLGNNTTISGDIFVDGDVEIKNNAEVVDGVVVTTEGHSVTGGGSWIPGTPPDPLPTPPTLDTTFYDNEIATALASGTVNYNYSGTLNLAGGTIYASNDINIDGTIIGPGSLVAGNNITIDNSTAIGSNILLICQNVLDINNNCTIAADTTLFATNQVTLHNNVVGTEIIILTPSIVDINNNVTITGFIFSGQLTLSNNVVFSGSIQTGGFSADNTIGNNSSITYDPSYLPDVLPPGLDVGYSLAEDSWKEL